MQTTQGAQRPGAGSAMTSTASGSRTKHIEVLHAYRALHAEPERVVRSVSTAHWHSAVHRRRISKTREESVTQEKTQQHKRRPSGTREDSATQPRPARRSDRIHQVLHLSRSLSSQKPKTETAVRRKAANIASRLTET